ERRARRLVDLRRRRLVGLEQRAVHPALADELDAADLQQLLDLDDARLGVLARRCLDTMRVRHRLRLVLDRPKDLLGARVLRVVVQVTVVAVGLLDRVAEHAEPALDGRYAVLRRMIQRDGRALVQPGLTLQRLRVVATIQRLPRRDLHPADDGLLTVDRGL